MANYFYALSERGNAIQISDDYLNFSLRAKYSVFTTPIAPGNGVASGLAAWSFDVVGNNPMIAFGGVNNAILTRRTQAGNVFTFGGLTGQNTGVFLVYVFDEPELNGPAQYLEIRNAANKLLFDGKQKYMRVVDMINENSQTVPGGRTYPAGRTYAIVAGLAGAVTQVAGGPITGNQSWFTVTSTLRPVVNIQNNQAIPASVQLSNRRIDGSNSTPYPPPGIRGTYQIFAPVLDVTGY